MSVVCDKTHVYSEVNGKCGTSATSDRNIKKYCPLGTDGKPQYCDITQSCYSDYNYSYYNSVVDTKQCKSYEVITDGVFATCGRRIKAEVSSIGDGSTVEYQLEGSPCESSATESTIDMYTTNCKVEKEQFCKSTYLDHIEANSGYFVSYKEREQVKSMIDYINEGCNLDLGFQNKENMIAKGEVFNPLGTS